MNRRWTDIAQILLLQAYLITFATAQEPSPLPIFAGPQNFTAKKLERPAEPTRLPDPLSVYPQRDRIADERSTPRVARRTGRATVQTPRATVESVTPQVFIHTTAPRAVDFGETLPYGITVHNRGEYAANDVVVQVQVPEHVKVTGSIPQAVALADGQIQFELGSLPPKSEKKLSIYVITNSAGTIDLEAELKFATTAKRSIEVRQPMLTIQRIGPQDVIYGVESTHRISVTNKGNAAARNVRLGHRFPEGVQLLNPEQWSGDIETLMPGQSRELMLSAVVQRTGQVEVEFFAIADMVEEISMRETLNVKRPMITVESSGPEVNYVSRSGVYTITIHNPGDAPVENIQIENRLPEGLKAAAVEREAMYKKSTRTLFWKIDSLPAGEKDSIRMRVDTLAEGHQLQQIIVRADHGLTAETEHATEVISRADISMSISDAAGPIAVGGTVEYEITVRNRGTRDGKDVEVRVVLPESMHAVE